LTRLIFHRILLARPDATRVAGFHTWKSLGRRVRKGSKGISIICPVVRRVKVRDQDSGEENVVVSSPTSFCIGYVFPYEDTDGELIPEIPCHRLNGGDPSGRYTGLSTVAHSLGYRVIEEDLPGTRNGDCTFVERRIRIDGSLKPAMRVKVLAHELAHALLHDPATGFSGGRDLAELEAESVAYVAGDGLGLDTGEYSFAYVAHWSGGGKEAIRGIAASAHRINKAAKQILDMFDAQVSDTAHAVSL
jgi:antirestriction protein ArdC